MKYSGTYSFYGGGIHQPETRGDSENEYIEKFKTWCKNKGGIYEMTEKEMEHTPDKVNICGGYNVYDKYFCYLGDKIGVNKFASCGNDEEKTGLNISLGRRESDAPGTSTGCELIEKAPVIKLEPGAQ